MDGNLVAGAGTADSLKEHDVAVAVITPKGTYPNEVDYHREANTVKVSVVLEHAARKLELTNTTDWVAHAHGRQIDVTRSFLENGLRGIVEIEWHKHEGGGGA